MYRRLFRRYYKFCLKGSPGGYTVFVEEALLDVIPRLLRRLFRR